MIERFMLTCSNIAKPEHRDVIVQVTPHGKSFLVRFADRSVSFRSASEVSPIRNDAERVRRGLKPWGEVYAPAV